MPDKAKSRGGSSEPTRFAETTPPIVPSGDYSYTLEIVMNMQHSVGKLTEAVDGLKGKQAEQGKKLDRISHQVYAAIVLLAVIGAILTFFAKSINDVITSHLLFAAPAAQQQLTIPTPTQAPQKSVR
jgi:hypothetical protein